MTTNDESSDSQCVGQKGMLPGLPTLGDVCFRVSNTSSNDEEVPLVEGASVKSVSRGTRDGCVPLAGLEFLQGCINGDSISTFHFRGIRDPDILQGAPSHLSSFLLQFSCVFFFFVNPTTLEIKWW